MDIILLAKSIEKSVGVLLDEIEKGKKAIISKARQDAMIEMRNAKRLSDEIIKRANRYLEHKLREAKKLENSENLVQHDFSNK
jgi:hypothetical protein